MFISADHLLNVKRLPDAFPVSSSTSKAQERQQPATRGLVTPAALVVFGVIANVFSGAAFQCEREPGNRLSA